MTSVLSGLGMLYKLRMISTEPRYLIPLNVEVSSVEKSAIQKEGPIMNSPSASQNIPTIINREAPPVEEQKSSKSNEDEYTYEEVEVEELVTDSEGEK